MTMNIGDTRVSSEAELEQARLAYADHLDEAGLHARADRIRVEVAYAQTVREIATKPNGVWCLHGDYTYHAGCRGCVLRRQEADLRARLDQTERTDHAPED
jgi:uncharacterized protein (TIGR02996 family)